MSLLWASHAGEQMQVVDDTHPHTQQSLNNLIALYEACNKPEKAKEWREKLAQIEDFEE